MNALKIQFPKSTFGLPNIIWQHSNEISIKSHNNLNVSTPMEHEEIVPPAHVWDKIAAILDEQDISKKEIQTKKSNYTFIKTLVIITSISILISTLFFILK